MLSIPSTLLSTLFSALAAALVVTPLVMVMARRRGVVDVPTPDGRKQHTRSTPLLGGLALATAFGIAIVGVAWTTGAPFAGRISPLELAVVLIAGLLLITGGAIDDRHALRPLQQFSFPLAAVLLTAAVGVGIDRVTHPSGSVLALAPWATVAFTILWLLGTTYTTKLLDGLDGLVVGLTAIGALLTAAFSLTTQYYQPDVAVIALALAGACLGFLVFNFHPARIFLGEGGSTLCGYLLGVLAIISGGKLATVLLVLGIPVVDAAAVMFQRLQTTGHPFTGDRRHLHFRLLTAGFSHRGAVLLYYALAAGFGSLALFLQSRGKLIALGVLVTLAVVLIAGAKVRAAVR